MAQALVIQNRCRELINTPPGTGNATLSGPVSSAGQGFVAFNSLIADGIPFPYAMRGQSSTLWEVGIGVLSSGALVRRVLRSSAGFLTAANFSSGVTEVVCGRHGFIVDDECTIGTGQDGALVVTGSTDIPLTDEKHYTSLSWQAGATAKLVGGYPVFAHACDLTNAPAGAINNDANGSTGGAWGRLGGGCNGVPNGSTTGVPMVGALLGGRAGAVSGGGDNRLAQQIGRLGWRARTMGIPAGGGGGVTASGATGGAGGGVIELWVGRLTRTSATGTGALRANGAAGVAGGQNAAGGGGGRPRLGYYELAGSSKTGLIQANGGNGTDSASADGGDGGTIDIYNLLTGAYTYVLGGTTTTLTGGTCSANV